MRNSTTVFNKAFMGVREPRSEQYLQGARAALVRCMDNGPTLTAACKYPSPSAERDAFYSGWDAGIAVYRQEVKSHE